ncbi:MAG TPA: BatD family protein [Steroidobacteraceae bacterium]|nr:BatD family protein [Steroidobacteraceae bacterium]
MRRLAACAALLISLAAAPALAAVQASLDKLQIGSGDTVQLTLTRDGQTDAQPDLTPLQRDFDVVSVSRSSNVQIINGNMSSQVQAQILLSPKHSGQLTVPPLTWGGEASAPLNLAVGKTAGGAAPADAAGAKVFLETTVGASNPYVQAAVDVTVRLYTALHLYQASLNFPGNGGVLVQQVGGDQQSTALKNGQQYDVVERHYVLFAQHSGQLQVPGAVLDGQVAVRLRDDAFGNDPFAAFFGATNGMLAGTKPIRVQGEPIALDVRPRPADSGSAPWLPAQGVRLSATWHPDSLRVAAGDPITLSLHAQADGLTAAQLPDLAAMLSLPAGIKAYPDQATLTNAAQGDLIVGSRDQSLALIADRAGRYLLPALHLSWWDTQADRAREADLPAQTIDVLPPAGGAAAPSTATAPGASAAAPAPAAPQASNPAAAAAASGASPANSPRSLSTDDRRWILVSAGLGLLWLATMIAWWFSRRRLPPAPAAGVAAATQSDASRRAAPAAPATSAVPPAPRAPAAAPPPLTAADAARARSHFHEACRRNDARAARRWLLAWAGASWPRAAPGGLTALAKRLAEPAAIEALQQLDRACYAGEPWTGEQLAQALNELRKPPTPGAAGGADIAGLYP